MIETTKFGRFYIPLDLIDLHPEAVVAALRGVLVLRAEIRYDMGPSIEYIGIHPEFREVPSGQPAPVYVANLAADEHGEVTRFSWKEQTK